MQRPSFNSHRVVSLRSDCIVVDATLVIIMYVLDFARVAVFTAKDEINVPIALSAFRDKRFHCLH